MKLKLYRAPGSLAKLGSGSESRLARAEGFLLKLDLRSTPDARSAELNWSKQVYVCTVHARGTEKDVTRALEFACALNAI